MKKRRKWNGIAGIFLIFVLFGWGAISFTEELELFPMLKTKRIAAASSIPGGFEEMEFREKISLFLNTLEDAESRGLYTVDALELYKQSIDNYLNGNEKEAHLQMNAAVWELQMIKK